MTRTSDKPSLLRQGRATSRQRHPELEHRAAGLRQQRRVLSPRGEHGSVTGQLRPRCPWSRTCDSGRRSQCNAGRLRHLFGLGPAPRWRNRRRLGLRGESVSTAAPMPVHADLSDSRGLCILLLSGRFLSVHSLLVGVCRWCVHGHRRIRDLRGKLSCVSKHVCIRQRHSLRSDSRPGRLQKRSALGARKQTLLEQYLAVTLWRLATSACARPARLVHTCLAVPVHMRRVAARAAALRTRQAATLCTRQAAALHMRQAALRARPMVVRVAALRTCQAAALCTCRAAVPPTRQVAVLRTRQAALRARPMAVAAVLRTRQVAALRGRRAAALHTCQVVLHTRQAALHGRRAAALCTRQAALRGRRAAALRTCQAALSTRQAVVLCAHPMVVRAAALRTRQMVALRGRWAAALRTRQVPLCTRQAPLRGRQAVLRTRQAALRGRQAAALRTRQVALRTRQAAALCGHQAAALCTCRVALHAPSTAGRAAVLRVRPAAALCTRPASMCGHSSMLCACPAAALLHTRPAVVCTCSAVLRAGWSLAVLRALPLAAGLALLQGCCALSSRVQAQEADGRQAVLMGTLLPTHPMPTFKSCQHRMTVE
jgi:hypothetical protein